MRVESTALTVLLALAGTSCREEQAPLLSVQAASAGSPAFALTFSPESALAAFVEVPAEAAELTLAFATYEAVCGRYVPPPTAEDAILSVVLTLPARTKPAATTYVWAGHEAHGGSPESPEEPYVEPILRRGRKSFTFPPGGGLRLTRVELERNGVVAGLLAFEFPGDAKHPATALKGSFQARLCEIAALAEN